MNTTTDGWHHCLLSCWLCHAQVCGGLGHKSRTCELVSYKAELGDAKPSSKSLLAVRPSATAYTSSTGRRRDVENEQHQHHLHAAYGLLTLASQPLSQVHKVDRPQVLMPWAPLAPKLVTA